MKLRLIAVDADTTLALASTKAFTERYGVRIDEAQRELALSMVHQTLEFHAGIEAHPPWVGYLSVDDETATVVGSCGFKGDPGCIVPEGMVEIAYMTFPEYEGRGYGTASALSLVDIAAAAHTVVNVLAHTLPERNASGSILTKAGFSLQGEVSDPQDGLVWRWRRPFGA